MSRSLLLQQNEALLACPTLKASRVKMRGKRSCYNTPADENKVTALKVKADFT